MAKSAQKINTTTQKFVGIQDIVDDVVMLPNGQSCLVLEVKATNFSLQSDGEQEAKIYSYAMLLNSLSFPIQILVISRELDISSYINLLDTEAKRAISPKLASNITEYKKFVQELVQVNTVLDKKFYVVLPYSFLEKGASAATGVHDKSAKVNDAKNFLHPKAKSLTQELLRIGLSSKILERNELIHLFYEIYNTDSEGVNIAQNIDIPMVQGTLRKA